MSEKYYRDINTNKDNAKFKLQLGAILLKLNEHNLSIKDNDSDIKSNYDICTANKYSLIDVDGKIYAVNNNITKVDNDNQNINNSITKINSDIEKINNTKIIKHNYSIENIWFYDIDILYDFIINKSKHAVILYEHEIESKFTLNSILEISCNILYKYANYNDIGLLRHIYSLLEADNSLIQVYNIIHTNSGDNSTNYLTMNNNFSILLKNSHTDNLKIKLQIAMVDVNRNYHIGFRILNLFINDLDVNDKINIILFMNYTFNSKGILVNLSIINLLSLKFLILYFIIVLVNNF